MKRYTFTALICLLCVALPATWAQERTKIGVVIPLSGVLAEYGVALKNGVLLAQKEHPELVKNIEFVFEDTRYGNITAITIINKFASSSPVDLVYMWGYGPCQAVAAVAESQKIAMLAVTGEQGVNVGRKYIMRFSFRIEQMSHAILEYLRSKGLKKIGIVKTEIAYMNGIIDGMSANLRADESLSVVDSYTVSDTDFRSSIEKLKRKKFDVLGVFLITGQVSQFYRQARALNLMAQTFGSSPFENLMEIRQAGGLMDGAVFPGPEISPDFKRRYVAEYGNDVQLAWAANAYDFSVLSGTITSQWAKAAPFTGLELLSEFKKISRYEGVEGLLEYKEDLTRGSGFEFPVVMKKIVGDSIVVLPNTYN